MFLIETENNLMFITNIVFDCSSILCHASLLPVLPYSESRSLYCSNKQYIPSFEVELFPNNEDLFIIPIKQKIFNVFNPAYVYLFVYIFYLLEIITVMIILNILLTDTGLV